MKKTLDLGVVDSSSLMKACQACYMVSHEIPFRPWPSLQWTKPSISSSFENLATRIWLLLTESLNGATTAGIDSDRFEGSFGVDNMSLV